MTLVSVHDAEGVGTMLPGTPDLITLCTSVYIRWTSEKGKLGFICTCVSNFSFLSHGITLTICVVVSEVGVTNNMQERRLSPVMGLKI